MKHSMLKSLQTGFTGSRFRGVRARTRMKAPMVPRTRSARRPVKPVCFLWNVLCLIRYAGNADLPVSTKTALLTGSGSLSV